MGVGRLNNIRNGITIILGLLFAIFSGSVARAQEATLEGTRTDDLAAIEEQVNATLERDMVLVLYRAGANFPHDFGMIATYKVVSRLRTRNVCEMSVLSFKLTPERHFLEEGPTFERAMGSMLSSRLFVQEANMGSVYALMDGIAETAEQWGRLARDCAAMENYDDFFGATDLETATQAIQLMQEFIDIRQETDGYDLSCDRLEEDACHSFLSQIDLENAENAAECRYVGSNEECIRFQFPALGPGATILMMNLRRELSEQPNEQRRLKVELSLYNPPVV